MNSRLLRAGYGLGPSGASVQPGGIRAARVRQRIYLEESWSRLQSRPKSELDKADPHPQEGEPGSGVMLTPGRAIASTVAVDNPATFAEEAALSDGAGLSEEAELGDAAFANDLERVSSFNPCISDIPSDHDDQMVLKTIGGDQDAFEVLVRRHSPRVFNIIGSFFRRRDTVEDIAQEVFIKSYTSLASYTLGRSFEAWLARITVNCCYDHLRAQRRRGEQSSPQDPDAESDWLDLQMLETSVSRHISEERQREAADIANRLLSKLLPEDRIVLILMDRDGYSVKEISDLTGWGASKVKVRAFRARRTLRTAMKRLVTSAERKQATMR